MHPAAAPVPRSRQLAVFWGVILSFSLALAALTVLAPCARAPEGLPHALAFLTDGISLQVTLPEGWATERDRAAATCGFDLVLDQDRGIAPSAFQFALFPRYWRVWGRPQGFILATGSFAPGEGDLEARFLPESPSLHPPLRYAFRFHRRMADRQEEIVYFPPQPADPADPQGWYFLP